MVSADPWLPASLGPAKVRALAKAVRARVRSGAVVEGRVRLCVHVREPKRGDRRTVALLPRPMPKPGDLPPPAGGVQLADPAHPEAVLDSLEVLDLTVRGCPVPRAHHPRRTSG